MCVFGMSGKGTVSWWLINTNHTNVNIKINIGIKRKSRVLKPLTITNEISRVSSSLQVPILRQCWCVQSLLGTRMRSFVMLFKASEQKKTSTKTTSISSSTTFSSVIYLVINFWNRPPFIISLFSFPFQVRWRKSHNLILTI